MRISDWSSDVCPSDLMMSNTVKRIETLDLHCCGWVSAVAGYMEELAPVPSRSVSSSSSEYARLLPLDLLDFDLDLDFEDLDLEIGRASCRERVCQYV